MRLIYSICHAFFFLTLLISPHNGFAAEPKGALVSQNVIGKPTFRGDVIFVRGGFSIFSGGLEQMAEKLRRQGVSVTVMKNGSANRAVAQILRNKQRYKQKPVVLVGHSWGGNEIIKIAQSLRQKKIEVNYLVTFAATNPAPIPNNVHHVTNFYFEKDGWGRIVRRGKGMRGKIDNVDVSKSSGVNHFNIDENTKFQNWVINNIVQVVGKQKNT